MYIWCFGNCGTVNKALVLSLYNFCVMSFNLCQDANILRYSTFPTLYTMEFALHFEQSNINIVIGIMQRSWRKTSTRCAPHKFINSKLYYIFVCFGKITDSSLSYNKIPLIHPHNLINEFTFANNNRIPDADIEYNPDRPALRAQLRYALQL